MSSKPHVNPDQLISILENLHPICSVDGGIKRLVSDEGYRAKPYKDHLGYLTIGIGTLLDKGGLAPEEIFFLFYNRLSKLVDEFESISGINLSDHPLEVAVALSNMSYQIGPKGLNKFKKMLGHVKNGDYKAAAQEAKNSRWYTQTPARAKRIIGLLESA